METLISYQVVVLDEAQCVNKRKLVRHKVIKNLSANTFLIVSGTLAHNKWFDFSGYLDFLQKW
ncbi:hypothetical protein F5884DRAFT_796867 [Xylogone sp. PMI_703]|nr:hypothetical protein F5884DRAFT_796867 [Xylogone sp. PMI_703]